MGRVIVVGSVNVDFVIDVDHLPAPGETVTGGRFQRHHGGKGANQAVAAARLGADVTFIGAIGTDGLGEDATAALEAEGVATDVVRLDDDATGVAMILVDRSGENSIAVASGANLALTSVQVRAAMKRVAPRPGDVVLVGHEIRTGAAHEALRLGRIAGATTILDPAPAGGLGRPTLDLADVLTPNLGELRTLGGEGRTATIAKALLGKGAGRRAVVVSLGPDGALLVVGRKPVTYPAKPVEAVDTVGAGDALNGTLAAGLAAGTDLEPAVRRAVMAASLAVTRAGAREGMPTVKELRAAMRRA